MTSKEIFAKMLDETLYHLNRAGHDRFSDEMHLSVADYNMVCHRVSYMHKQLTQATKQKEK